MKDDEKKDEKVNGHRIIHRGKEFDPKPEPRSSPFDFSEADYFTRYEVAHTGFYGAGNSNAKWWRRQ